MLTELEVEEEQISAITIVAKRHLSTDAQFVGALGQLYTVMRGENNCNFINFYTKFIGIYKNLYLSRTNEL
jgi:hypothetical protein